MRMGLQRTVVSVAIAIVVAVGQLHAAEPKIRMTGIYSDLSYNQEGGDLLGTEIFIVRANEGYVAFVQKWLGAADAPLVVSVKVDRGTVSFTVPDGSGGKAEYNGRISATGFDGTFRYPSASGGVAEDQIHLKRKKSYWQ